LHQYRHGRKIKKKIKNTVGLEEGIYLRTKQKSESARFWVQEKRSLFKATSRGNQS
jgi:hypothetical protein